MTRGAFIESVLMQIYGQKPSDDAEITYNLVNLYLSEGIGLAAQASYKGAIQLDGVGYVNNGFYSTFSGIAISQDLTDNQSYIFTLPEIPAGIGSSMGLSSIKFRDSNGYTSFPAIPLSNAQWAYFESMPVVPNKILIMQEGRNVKAKTSLILSSFTATARLISGGNSSDFNSELNVPPDYVPIIRDYIIKQLMAERMVPQDNLNDGQDENIKQI